MSVMAPEQIPMDVLERVVPTLRVLMHPVRLKLVELLLSERIPVGELADRVGVRPNVASQHLNSLRAHGVVQARRDGKQVFYEVVSPEAGKVLDCIRTHHM